MPSNAILGPLVAAIPARDEAAHIRRCIEALSTQQAAALDHIVLLVNNSTDGTAALARSAEIPGGPALHVIECTLPPSQANAGHARRLAMQHAAMLAGGDGILLTTDADGEVDPDWLAATLTEIRNGADLVAGWVELDPIDWGAIPIRLHQDDARECAYDALCDEIHARLDPDPADPAPRHTQHSGASLAVTAAAYARSGGVPAIPCGEDRALVAALRRVDARIRHSLGVHVTVSGRTQGRSPGGMADTIRRRMEHPDALLDDRLEPAADCARRARCRADLRRVYDNPTSDIAELADRLRLPPARLALLLRTPHFGMAWDVVERVAPPLRRRPVAMAEVHAEIVAAQAILANLPIVPGDLSGIRALAPEGQG